MIECAITLTANMDGTKIMHPDAHSPGPGGNIEAINLALFVIVLLAVILAHVKKASTLLIWQGGLRGSMLPTPDSGQHADRRLSRYAPHKTSRSNGKFSYP